MSECQRVTEGLLFIASAPFTTFHKAQPVSNQSNIGLTSGLDSLLGSLLAVETEGWTGPFSIRSRPND